MPEVVEPTSEKRMGPNLIIKRYTTQSDVGDGFFGIPSTEQGCQKQIKPSYWWVCLYHPIELCTLALGQVASENDICWTSWPSLPRSDLWWVRSFLILGPPMNEDEGTDKRHLGPSCILSPCSRIEYRAFHASHNRRSCSFSFLGWSARTFPSPTGHVSQYCWLLPSTAFSGVGLEMALIYSRVSWCYVYPLRKYKVPCHHWREQVWGQECWIGGVHQDKRCPKSSSCSKGSKCKLQWRMPWWQWASQQKENTWSGVSMTSGRFGSNSVKKEGVFICRIRFKEYHDR